MYSTHLTIAGSFTASTAVSLSFYTVNQPGEMVGLLRVVRRPPGGSGAVLAAGL